MNKLKLKDKIISILTYLVFILALWYTVWTITGGDDSRGDLLIGISRQWYFSNQSNTLVVIATGLFWLRLNDKKWFKYFASIVATNIFITATGYHFILQHPDGISFYGHLGHTYVPIAYILWYFLSVKALKLKMFWINIIYPLTYLFLVIYVTKTWPLGEYPYGFLDPTDLAFNPDGINSVLRFTLTIMFPAYLFVAFLMTLLKSMIERKPKQISKK